MRAIAGFVLGCGAALAGCPRPGSEHCLDGSWCPPNNACIGAGGACGPTEEVVACAGANADAGASARCRTEAVPTGYCSQGLCTPCTVEQSVCPTSGWEAMQSPTTENLTGLAIVSSTEAYAVGDRGTVVAYDGTGWKAFDSPGTAVSLTDVWAIQDANQRTHLFATAFGQIWHHDGMWRKETLPPAITMLSVPLSVWGTSPEHVFASFNLGPNTDGLLHYDGLQWAEVDSGAPQPIRWLHGRSAADAVAVTTLGIIRELSGTAWTSSGPTPMPPASSFEQVWVGSEGAAFVVGTATGTPLVWRRASPGGAWAAEALPALPSGSLKTIGGWGADTVIAGGATGLLLHLEAGAWTQHPPPVGVTPADVYEIRASATGDFFAVGQGGAIWRYRPD